MTSCPHCQSPLPEPLPAQCPSCGGVVTPTGGAQPADNHARDTGGLAHPPDSPRSWDERDRLGLASAFVETTRQVLTGPTAFFRRMSVTGGLGSPLLYGVIAGWIGLTAAAFYQAIWGSIVGRSFVPFAPEAGRLPELVDFLGSWAVFAGQVIFGGIEIVITTFIVAGILHLMLLLLGGAPGRFEATFRVACYGQATSLLLLVPFCGFPVTLVWRVVVYVIGLAEAHRIGHGRALAAVLLPVLAVCCCCAGLGFAFAGVIASLLGQMR